jgi:hypothetical protein
VRPKHLTLVAVEAFLAGAFLVTPTGLLALVAVAFFGPLFAPVLAVARFLVAAGVGSGTVGKTLGREFPICGFSHARGAGYAPRSAKAPTRIEEYEEYGPVAERVPSRAIVSYKTVSINVRRGG